MAKTFVIEHFGTTEFAARLKQETEPFHGNDRPLKLVLEHLPKAPLNCQSVVFEYEYIDKDYQDEFSTFYSKSFKQYGSRCVRLHFFSVLIPKGAFLSLAVHQEQYLGFMVIRPTDLQRMGRTILRPTITDPNREFVHCQARFTAHILGEEFQVSAMPFIQQDTQVGACAQASLWMVARYMSAKFGYREFLPGEINRLAKTHVAMGRPLPAERGLNPIQILDAFQGMGFSALSYSSNAVDDCSPHIDRAYPVTSIAHHIKAEEQKRQRIAKLADIAYRYIESGLPVILGTENHALVAIGHTYDPSVPAQVAIQRIPAFIVNNDNSGPYLEMPVFSVPPPPALSFSAVTTIFPIIPAEVSLRGEEAELMAVACVEQFLMQPIPGLPGRTYGELVETQLPPEMKGCLGSLEYRTFLQPSVKFQHDLRLEMVNGFSKPVGEQMLQLDYPKFVWVTEVSYIALLNKPVRAERKCLGRIVIDSTAPARTRGEMVFHFADFLQIPDRQTGKPGSWTYFDCSTPFAHKLLT